MGMFDELLYRPKLQENGIIFDCPEKPEHLWQTKSLDCSMDLYEVRKNGTLWVETYDVVDRSDPTAEGLESLAGLMTRVNKKWIHLSGFTGEINFYTFAIEYFGGKYVSGPGNGWIEWSSYFVKGHLESTELLRFDAPLMPEQVEK